jgi:hypothetical protein
MRENQDKSSLSKRQQAALAGLLCQPTIALAAGQAGVGEASIYRWMSEDERFKSEYLKLRQEVVRNAVFQLQKSTNNAVNCLTSVMNDPESPASARVRAAVAVLEQAMKALEIESLEERIARLERLYEQQSVVTNGHRIRRGPYSY